MKSSIGKYKAGLAVLGLFTVGLLVMVLLQASTTKQDAVTTKAAEDIANKLNNYVTSKQKVPTTLSEVGAKDVPATVSYTKLDSSSYKFCMTYKATSSDFDATQAIDDVVTGSYGKYSSFSSSSSSANDNYYLSVPSSHHKGANCQTIKSSLYSSSSYYDNQSSSDSSLTSLFSGSQTVATDTERETDIKTLQSQLEAAYATSGVYPTLNQLNDSAWRAKNMPGMDKEALKDPKGSDYKVVAKPSAGAYSYDVNGKDGGSCDNVTNDCTEYTITATLNDGTEYPLLSLNY